MKPLVFTTAMLAEVGIGWLVWQYTPASFWPHPCGYPSLSNCNREFLQIMLALAVGVPVVLAIYLWTEPKRQH